MSMDLGVIGARLKMDTSGWSSQLKGAISGLSQLGNIVSGLRNGLDLMRGAFMKVFGAFRSYMGNMVGIADRMEKFKLTLGSLLRSSEAGQKMFEKMSLAAQKLPFEYDKIMESATRLAGVLKGDGESIIKQTEEWMPRIADLAATYDIEITDMTGQFIRMMSAGVSAAELLKERGITAALGFTNGVKYSVEETKNKLAEILDDANGKFKGNAEKLAKTWSGLVSMFGDQWTNFQLLVSNAGIFDAMKSRMKEILDLVYKLSASGEIKEWAEITSKAVAGVINFVLSLARTILTIYAYWKYASEGAYMFALDVKVWANQAGVNLLEAIAGAIRKVKQMFIDLGDWLAGFYEKVGNAYGKMGEMAGKAADSVFTGPVADLGLKAFEKLTTGAKGMIQNLSDGIRDYTAKVGADIANGSSGNASLDDAIKAAKEKLFSAQNMRDGFYGSVANGEDAKLAETVMNALKTGDWGILRDLDLDKFKFNAEGMMNMMKGLAEETQAKMQGAGKAARDMAKDVLSKKKELEENLRDIKFEMKLDGMTEAEKAVARVVEEAKRLREEIEREYNNDKGLLGLASQIEALKKSQLSQSKATEKQSEEMELASGIIKDFTSGAVGPLTEFMTTMQETGKADFSGLIKNLGKQIQIMAAAKTAQLLMTAAYEGIMMIIDKANSGDHSTNAMLALKGAAIMGSFTLGSMLAGMAHGGISEIPKEGTWLLDKGERVVDSKTNEDLKGFLKDNGKPGVVMNVTINGGDQKGVEAALPAMRKMIVEAVTSDVSTNGPINKAIRTYAR